MDDESVDDENLWAALEEPIKLATLQQQPWWSLSSQSTFCLF